MLNGLKEIFPDFALTRSGTVIHLAVIGYSERLERFASWLAKAAPAASHRSTKFDYEVFGARKEDVFDFYDHILRIEFSAEAEAVAFGDYYGRGLFFRKPAHKRNLAPLKSKPKAFASASGITLSPLRSMPIRDSRGKGGTGGGLDCVSVTVALGCKEIDQRTAIIRLGLSGRIALRRLLIKGGWLATWPSRPRTVTSDRYL
jgi:hypothetical protein